MLKQQAMQNLINKVKERQVQQPSRIARPTPRPSIPDTPPIGENTRIKKPAVDDRGVPIGAPQQPKPPQMEYLPGSGGTKMPIYVGGPAPEMPTFFNPNDPSLKRTPEEIAETERKLAIKRSLNPNPVVPTREQREAEMRAMQLAAQRASSPVNPGGPSMGLGSTPPGSAQPSMGPAPTMRTPVRPTSPEQMMKKGGQAKAYASGGTVRGSGIAQRGVKKCKIY